MNSSWTGGCNGETCMCDNPVVVRGDAPCYGRDKVQSKPKRQGFDYHTTKNCFMKDKVLKENKIVYEYYLNRYKEKDSIKEVIYRIKNNLEEKPKCPICGNNAKFDYLKNHYIKCCENKQCQILYNKIKVKEAFLLKYGVSNASQLPSHKEKTKNTRKLKN